MINYESSTSPFFENNKKFCTEIELNLNELNYKYSGFCNSYGYEINSIFLRNNFEFKIRLFKNQTTRSGIITPIDAFDFTGIELEINTLKQSISITFGKNKLKRLFTSKSIKNKIPSPFYLSTNYKLESQEISNLLHFLLETKVDSFEYKNGNALFELNQSSLNIIHELDKFEKIVLSL